MVIGFKPLISNCPKYIILGSAPSVKSLEENQYYGHPRNSFWKIIASIYDYDEFKSYQEKKQFILDNNIILWDVIKTCSREGSLDSKIKDVIVNELVDIINDNPTIKAVFFNGKKSFELYKKYINYYPSHIDFINLPSTSPAYTLSYEKKLKIWNDNISIYK